jgi:hypothetical protein
VKGFKEILQGVATLEHRRTVRGDRLQLPQLKHDVTRVGEPHGGSEVAPVVL